MSWAALGALPAHQGDPAPLLSAGEATPGDWVLFWAPHPERNRQRAMKITKKLELRELGLLCLEKRRLREISARDLQDWVFRRASTLRAGTMVERMLFLS